MDIKNNANRGGARAGAGRKTKGDAAKTKTMSIVCTEKQCNKIKALAMLAAGEITEQSVEFAKQLIKE